MTSSVIDCVSAHDIKIYATLTTSTTKMHGRHNHMSIQLGVHPLDPVDPLGVLEPLDPLDACLLT